MGETVSGRVPAEPGSCRSGDAATASSSLRDGDPSRCGASFKVVRLSEGQLHDVRPDDVLADGWFRLCETYRGGGGYDLFPDIARRRLGYAHHRQFVVQLLGCHLDCPYCYVTREGVWGEHRRFSARELVAAFIDAFHEHGTTVFHLMGGAPALSMKHWPSLISEFEAKAPAGCAFHSDLLLTEGIYDADTLRAISRPQCLYAADVKGLTPEEHLRNTRKPFDEALFWENLDKLERVGMPYYLTFTAVGDPEPFWQRFQRLYPGTYATRRSEAFTIDLIDYDALPFVDRVPWGGGSASAMEAEGRDAQQLGAKPSSPPLEEGTPTPASSTSRVGEE